MNQETKSPDGAAELTRTAQAEITHAEPLNPFAAKFTIDKQPALGYINPPDIEQPTVTINAQDFIPVIPQIIAKTMFNKNWKTTVIGFLCGMGYGVLDYMQSGQTITWKGVLGVLGLSAWGYFTSDAKK